MVTTQGNFLYSYLKQTKMSFIFLLQIREQEGRTGPIRGVEPVGGLEGQIWYKICVLMYVNGK
jgi:hypothetical protein